MKDSGDEVVNGHPIERQMLPRKGDIEIKSNQFIRPRVDTRLPRDGAWLEAPPSRDVVPSRHTVPVPVLIHPFWCQSGDWF